MIQIKRGIKANLPILSLGEPAFTTDTKEIFIGDGAKNFALESNHQNLMLNSNFQITFRDFDVGTTSITIKPGSEKYIFGHYYIKNPISSTGDITITRTYNDGNIKIDGQNVSIQLEYREKLPRYNLSTGGISYIKQLKGKVVTLSFDYNNTSTNSIENIGIGYEKNLITTNILSGVGRKNISFNMDYDETITYPMMKIILFKTTTNSNLSIYLGRYKLENGTKETKYSLLPYYYEALAISRVFIPINRTIRSLNIGNTLKFFIPLEVPEYFNYDIKVYSIKYILAAINGATQSNYNIIFSYNYVLRGIDITCSSLTIIEGYLNFVGYIDLRPM